MGDSVIVGLSKICTDYDFDKVGQKTYIKRKMKPFELLSRLKTNAHYLKDLTIEWRSIVLSI